jgi:hypothetical protein
MNIKYFINVYNYLQYFFFLYNCVDRINGTHVRTCISSYNQILFIERKCVPTQNVMTACSFDMQFMFVWAGWEDSAPDTCIFLEAINSSSIKFPKPPEGCDFK